MAVDRARLGRAGWLLAFAALVTKLLVTGQMAKYMTPALDPLSAATAVVLAAMAALEGRAALRGRPRRLAPTEPASLATRFERLAVGTLVLAPVALGLLVAPRALGTGALGGERVADLLVAFASTGAADRVVPGRGDGEPPLGDMSALLAHLRNVGERGIGRHVRLTGLLVRSDTLGADEMALLRYAIAHCVADARPVALLVVGSTSPDLPADQWVQVEGTVAVRPRGPDRLVTVVARRITLIEEPANPYLPSTY